MKRIKYVISLIMILVIQISIAQPVQEFSNQLRFLKVPQYVPSTNLNKPFKTLLIDKYGNVISTPYVDSNSGVTSVNGQIGEVILDIPDANSFVPYTGATTNVDLGSNQFDAGIIQSNIGGEAIYLNRYGNALGLYHQAEDQIIADFNHTDNIYKYGNGTLQVDNSSIPQVNVIGEFKTFDDLGNFCKIFRHSGGNPRFVLFDGDGNELTIEAGSGYFYFPNTDIILATNIDYGNPNLMIEPSIESNEKAISIHGYEGEVFQVDKHGKLKVIGGATSFCQKTTTEINALTGMVEGDTYYNTTLHTIVFYNGTFWQQIVTIGM